jgi:uncharacterized protein
VFQRLDPRLIEAQRIAGWITMMCLSGPGLVILTGVLLRAGTPVWGKGLAALAWIVGTALLIWSAHWWPAIAYRYASYAVDEHGIEIRSGVIWRHQTTVPRSRVQHTDVSQGPILRRYGLGTLVIHTAGTEHAMVELPGLDHARALALRDHLLPRGAGDAV